MVKRTKVATGTRPAMAAPDAAAGFAPKTVVIHSMLGEMLKAEVDATER